MIIIIIIIIIITIIIIIIIIIYSLRVSDEFSLVFEWLEASSCLLDSSQYSGQSQQYCSLDFLHLTSYFQVL